MPREPKPHLNKGYWRCRIGGIEHHLGKDKPQAFWKFHQLMADRVAPVDLSRPVLVSEIIDLWQHHHPSDDYVKRLKEFLTRFGNRILSEVDKDILSDYHRHLKRQRLAPKTIRDRVQTAARVLVWAHERGWLDAKTINPRMAQPVRKARDIPIDKLAGLFASLPETASRILRFILETGCRPIEARHLRWSEVDTKRQVCVIHKHKTGHTTGKPRTLYLTPGSIAVLSATPRTSEFVFPTDRGKAYTSQALQHVFRTYCGFSPSQLRHTFAQIRSEEIETAELAKLLGHTQLSTTQFYFQVRDARARRVAGQLSALVPPDDAAQAPVAKSPALGRQSKKRPSPPRAKTRVS